LHERLIGIGQAKATGPVMWNFGSNMPRVPSKKKLCMATTILAAVLPHPKMLPNADFMQDQLFHDCREGFASCSEPSFLVAVPSGSSFPLSCITATRLGTLLGAKTGPCDVGVYNNHDLSGG
jgi:hypothetical protein